MQLRGSWLNLGHTWLFEIACGMDALAVGNELVSRIYLIRGHKVMLSHDLAELYGVETKRLTEQVMRNPERFPSDFMFQLTKSEWENLKSQNATSSWGGVRKLPYAFTEHGAIMLASVLKSAQAVAASIVVVRAFVQMRTVLAAHVELARKLDEMEDRFEGQFQMVFDALRELMSPPAETREPIGFRPGENA